MVTETATETATAKADRLGDVVRVKLALADGDNPGDSVDNSGLLGAFSGYASVFGNIDSYGDIVMKGAFLDSIAAYKAAGKPVPVYWMHRTWDAVSEIIGRTTDLYEDEHGLRFAAQLYVDENPDAKYVAQLIADRVLCEMSFGFRVVEGRWATRDGEDVYELVKLELIEISVVTKGANPLTSIDGIKSAEVSPVMAALAEIKDLLVKGAPAPAAGEAPAVVPVVEDVPGDAPGGDGVAVDAKSDETAKLADLVNFTNALAGGKVV